MKIYPIQIIPTNEKTNKPRTRQNFCGLKTSVSKAGFFLDYDDSLARKMSGTIRSKIRKLQKRSNAELVVVSGNNIDEFLTKLSKISPEERMPNIKYLISNDGPYIYQKTKGKWVKDEAYEEFIREKTGYNSAKVLEVFEQMAETGKFKLSQEKIQELKNLENFENIQNNDPKFYDSAYTPYSWNPTEFTNKLLVADGTDIKHLETEITKELLKRGIKAKFIKIEYPKHTMDRCSESLLLQSNQTRRSPQGSMSALFIQAALKADGVEYLAKKLGIKHEDMILAGDAENDKSLVHLAKKGAKFICIENAQKSIKDLCAIIKQKHPNNIHFSNKEGAEGIVEGAKDIITV